MTEIARSPRTGLQRAAVWGGLVCLMAFSGCRSATWRAPDFARPQPGLATPRHTALAGPPYPILRPSDVWQHAAGDPLMAAEESYTRGCQLESEGLAACVDAYYQSAVRCWPIVERGVGAGDDSGAFARGWELYHSALAKTVSTGQFWGRLDPRSGLTIQGPAGAARVAVRHVGGPWRPEDFTRLTLVGDYSHKMLTHSYRRLGLGVPVVVHSADKAAGQLLRPHQVFAATAVLRPSWDASGSGMPGPMTLELVDPLRVSSLPAGSGPVPLASDLSAPIAYRLMPRDRNPVRGFLQRGYTGSDAGLYMIEPYQAGKIPLVFVHGLLSDPLTWADLANELRARPDLVAGYQLWAFEYPTGQPFLRSAATLREKLGGARQQLDPWHQDLALDQMVLIGHSLGGLVSKLQVSTSGSRLWDAIANRPLAQVRADPATTADLAKLFFFQPVPSVQRVIFMGTPHRGSAWAARGIGRLGARLVSLPTEKRARYRQLVGENPDVFAPEIRLRIPTSVDLLEPSSRLLQSMETLPISPTVQLHSIIGTGHRMLGYGPADGVVPVSSARHVGASEKFVDARHERLHRDPQAVAEVIRILRTHLGVPVP